MSKFYFHADDNGSCYVYRRGCPTPLASRLNRLHAARLVEGLNAGDDTDNLRFWDFVNGGWVKLTLYPGKRLQHTRGGPCDEGYQWTTETWWRDDDGLVHCRYQTDGRDCDGRYSSEQEVTCDPKFLDLNDATDADGNRLGFGTPAWATFHSSQRDHAAEVAGY